LVHVVELVSFKREQRNSKLLYQAYRNAIRSSALKKLIKTAFPSGQDADNLRTEKIFSLRHENILGNPPK
jgi:hypothetical protein